MRRARGERGQILTVVALALVALLGISAFAIDVGFAYYAKRQLQSATDAAALAGAQDLPAATTAVATATSYATANKPANLSGINFTYQTKCTATAVIATGCNAAVNPNAIVVTGTATTNTWFARIFGINSFSVSARANACSPCSSTPVDIVIAIDRTGSMCLDEDNDHDCTDLNNAKAGVRTMLGMLNPPYSQIGMIAFPPLQSTSTNVCSSPQGTSNDYTAYDSANRGYLADQIGSDYKTAGVLNTNSGLYKHTVSGDSGCILADGYTSYSEALRRAQAELNAHGRANVPDVIVFLTDGEANIGSIYGVDDPVYPPGNLDDEQPCHTAINVADNIKAAGTTIYSIGYALGSNTKCTGGGWTWIDAVPAVKNKKGQIITPAIPAHYCDPAVDDEDCKHRASDHNESPTIYSDDTVEDIASPGNFYNKPSAGQLNTIFAAIATDIGSGSSRLVDDGF
jgi:Flp pilus assembly protein TadG